MKKVKLTKKLQLNKETIANLNKEGMVKLQGGSDPACHTYSCHVGTCMYQNTCTVCPTND